MAETPYEWTIGVRYLRSTHRSGFVSFVASMSVAGKLVVLTMAPNLDSGHGR